MCSLGIRSTVFCVCFGHRVCDRDCVCSLFWFSLYSQFFPCSPSAAQFLSNRMSPVKVTTLSSELEGIFLWRNDGDAVALLSASFFPSPPSSNDQKYIPARPSREVEEIRVSTSVVFFARIAWHGFSLLTLPPLAFCLFCFCFVRIVLPFCLFAFSAFLAFLACFAFVAFLLVLLGLFQTSWPFFACCCVAVPLCPCAPLALWPFGLLALFSSFPLYLFSSFPLFLFSYFPLPLCPSAPLPLCPSAPLPLCPSAPLPLCPFAPLPLCSFAPLPLCSFAPLLLLLFAPLPLCPFAPFATFATFAPLPLCPFAPLPLCPFAPLPFALCPLPFALRCVALRHVALR